MYVCVHTLFRLVHILRTTILTCDFLNWALREQNNMKMVVFKFSMFTFLNFFNIINPKLFTLICFKFQRTVIPIAPFSIIRLEISEERQIN